MTLPTLSSDPPPVSWQCGNCIHDNVNDGNECAGCGFPGPAAFDQAEAKVVDAPRVLPFTRPETVKAGSPFGDRAWREMGENALLRYLERRDPPRAATNLHQGNAIPGDEPPLQQLGADVDAGYRRDQERTAPTAPLSVQQLAAIVADIERAAWQQDQAALRLAWIRWWLAVGRTR